MVIYTNNYHFLNQASYGSIPGKIATLAVLEKVLSISIEIGTKGRIIFDCDANGCYDMILPPLMTMYVCALGLAIMDLFVGVYVAFFRQIGMFGLSMWFHTGILKPIGKE